jgi:UDP-galactopyranose mutase
VDQFDYLIVGAGFAGAVCARQLADAGKRVCVVDRRNHIGGNAFDMRDTNGLLIHPYGPHIFHTNSERVFSYLSQFTEWRLYEHRVLAKVGEQFLPIPINKTTINKLYDLNLGDDGVVEYLNSVKIKFEKITNSEEVVLSSVGSDLCEKFFRGYTKKQWGLDLSELSAGVAARIPTRTDDDDRYFSDVFQYMPKNGYTAMFEKMLGHPNIEVRTSVDYKSIRSDFGRVHLVYTGPIDVYYDQCFGPLPYRSLRFDHVHMSDSPLQQKVGTINYPNDYEYTRITEFRHLTGESGSGTSLVYEYPQAEGDPYYPIPRPENESVYLKYRELADRELGVTFVGRLAQYRYYNMDQIVAAALKAMDDHLASI